MVGAKFIDYLLDKSRVTSPEDKGRTFHIFSLLFSDATYDERTEWRLTSDSGHFQYLSTALSRFVSTQDIVLDLDEVRTNLKSLGVGRRQQSQMFKILAAILHLGNITFQDPRPGSQEACAVKNTNQLQLVGDLLSVQPHVLEQTLVYKTRRVGKGRDTISIFLSAKAAEARRDSFAQALYSVMFTWIMEQINDKLCKDDDGSWANFVSILEVPGFAGGAKPVGNGFRRLLSNYANEKIRGLVVDTLVGAKGDEMVVEGIEGANAVADLDHGREIIEVLAGVRTGVFEVLEAVCKASGKVEDLTKKFVNGVYEQNEDSKVFVRTASPNKSFAVKHYRQEVGTEYTVSNFIESNTDALHSDFVDLVRGTPEQQGTGNAWLRMCWSDEIVATKRFGADVKTGEGGVVVQARSLGRRPSTKKRGTGVASSKGGSEWGDSERGTMVGTLGRDGAGGDGEVEGGLSTVADQFITSFKDLLATIEDTNAWHIFHIHPSDPSLPSPRSHVPQFNPEIVQAQLAFWSIPAIAAHPASLFVACHTLPAFIARYGRLLEGQGEDDRMRVLKWAKTEGYVNNVHLSVGRTKVYLSERIWRHLETLSQPITFPFSNGEVVKPPSTPKKQIGQSDSRTTSPESQYQSDYGSDLALTGHVGRVGERSDVETDYESDYVSEVEGSGKGWGRGGRQRGMSQSTVGMGSFGAGVSDVELGIVRGSKDGKKMEIVDVSSGKKEGGKKKKEKRVVSGSRKRWVCFVWFTTWWIPGPFLRLCGKMKRGERRMAWREKVALCFFIFLMNAAILFWIIGLGWVLCPKKAELSPGEVSIRNDPSGGRGKAYVYMYGNYYDIGDIMKDHMDNFRPNNIPAYWRDAVLGKDVSSMFPKDRYWSKYCVTFPSKPSSFSLFPDANQGLQDVNWAVHGRQDDLDLLDGYVKGRVVFDAENIKLRVQGDTTKRVVTMYGRVFDLSPFFAPAYRATRTNFLGTTVGTIFDSLSAAPASIDLTDQFERFRASNGEQWANVMDCLDHMFLVGWVDRRNDAKCLAPNWILFASTCVLVAVIGVKFLAALQFGSGRIPEEHDKFVVCQVPCYTEGEGSLRRTIDSLSVLDYDSRRRLLFIIADGMIIGSGNDRPTPRIVLDILGVDPSVDPEPVMFQSLGEGNKQLNYAKVYAGLYENEGRATPFVVVVKVGKVSERVRPGNRGKRDSQLILMKFLSKVHYNLPMNPMELEVYHAMKNVIGVEPSFYEYVLMVDADTEVRRDSLNRLVSQMVRDSKIAGICGETRISNEKQSWVSMIQVYEYFISHHMAKAFESLFGSVTCLPGCFCMYRVRTPTKAGPVLVHQNLIKDYSENRVDTLHLKNLLHLGEDRYLTTLMMKYFPTMKTTFIQDAKCETVAPDRWTVLQSQRRRWINSTVHNLFELLFLPDMCGMCCFSMRFVVFLDLFATFVQPAVLIYLGYLIYSAVVSGFGLSGSEQAVVSSFPVWSIVMLGLVYGLQIIIFLLKREWQHVGWMIIYLLATPIFSFYVPIYSFWHMDDFSWGNTRMVVEEGKKVEKEVEAEEFDPSIIPLKKWADYEYEQQMQYDRHSDEAYTVTEGGYPASAYGGSQYTASAYGGSQYPASAYGTAYDVRSAYGDESVYGAESVYTSNGYGHPASGHMPMPTPTPPVYAGMGAMGRSPIMPTTPVVAPVAAAMRQNRRRATTSSAESGSSPDEEAESVRSDSAVITDGMIISECRAVLAKSDLMTVTKRTVREEVERRLGVDLTSRKTFVHGVIDGILSGKM
ncbi:hypothetical protein HK097_008635 [Rhizophlyctis rosea]|uniref:chitin synthase n=1 Tax=Rhizophlyctis rosea TaxID=64517 RepID=A0AAD5SD98_9FUNG|nr:hypothetical protein HK097_008635 [Rhizophlyctis rosea]